MGTVFKYIVLDSFNKAYRKEDNILNHMNKSKYFITMILILFNIIRKYLLFSYGLKRIKIIVIKYFRIMLKRIKIIVIKYFITMILILFNIIRKYFITMILILFKPYEKSKYFRIMLKRIKIIVIKYLLLFIWFKMLSSFRYALLKLSKTIYLKTVPI